MFASHAWGVTDGEVSRVCEALQSWGRVVLRDQDEVRLGDSIREFLKRAGTASRVLLVVGEKYSASEYCTTEWHEIYHRSGGDAAEF